MLHLPHVLRLFMHPHHGAGGDVPAGSVELCAESLEMEDILPRGYRGVRSGCFLDGGESRESCIVRGDRRLLLAPISTSLEMRSQRRVAKEGLSPERCCDMIWRDSWV